MLKAEKFKQKVVKTNTQTYVTIPKIYRDELKLKGGEVVIVTIEKEFPDDKKN